MTAIVVCNVTRFTQMFVTLTFQTCVVSLSAREFRIGSPYAMAMFSWTAVEAVQYMSASQAVFGGMVFGIYLLHIIFNLSKLFDLYNLWSLA